MRGTVSIFTAAISLLVLAGCAAAPTGAVNLAPAAPVSATLTAATASEPVASSAMPAGHPGLTPAAYTAFCARDPGQCTQPSGKQALITLDQAAWNDLVRINQQINDAIKPMTDAEHYGVAEYWTVPTDGYGDCEDLALAKRKALLDAGYPASSLRLAVAITARNERHAVLTVATDHGDYVLDNLAGKVLPWAQSGYIWLSRQDPDRAMAWVTLNAMPEVATAATAALR